ncbi:MAG: DNA repair protein RecO C-terminal domain-containing protein [Treponema sp.]|jgi:DNA repair protein RecO (recombination protein O)|nr:DNA repair protein RecO C-terminal domain-containing protein [Treponema sp.]
MNRTASCQALVLRVRPSGEHREAEFLSSEEGIVRATVFGGPKSHLRSHVAPFHSGTLWIYHDPVKDTRRVNDFDVVSWRPGLRELYERAGAASAIAGLVLKSRGGGGAFAQAAELVRESLDALESADESRCPQILVRFMWNWAGLLGQKPSLERCSSCACELRGDEVLWFIRGEGLLCGNCIRRAAGSGQDGYTGPALGPGARRWLRSVENGVSRTSPDAPSLAEAEALVRALLGDALPGT